MSIEDFLPPKKPDRALSVSLRLRPEARQQLDEMVEELDTTIVDLITAMIAKQHGEIFE